MATIIKMVMALLAAVLLQGPTLSGQGGHIHWPGCFHSVRSNFERCMSNAATDREKMEVGGSSFWQSVIPVAANSPGRFGAHFKTRVVISNPTTRDYSIAAHLYGKDGPIRQVQIPINAEEYYVWDNFLEEVFDYRGSGAVWLAASDREAEFYVTAEVYTDSPNGRFSTTVVNGIAPAYTEGREPEYNFGISVNESRRTNIGVWNWELETSSIEAQVFDAFGTLVQTIAFELNAEAWQQKSISASVDNGFVRWNINGESEAHYFYAVEVDNASNDGTLNWSVKGPKSIASGTALSFCGLTSMQRNGESILRQPSTQTGQASNGSPAWGLAERKSSVAHRRIRAIRCVSSTPPTHMAPAIKQSRHRSVCHTTTRNCT